MQAVLTYRVIEFTHTSDEPLALMGHTGSLLRGVFGHALKAVLCAREGLPDCTTCPEAGSCAYVQLFMQLAQRTTAIGTTPKVLLQEGQQREAAIQAGQADQWPAPYVLDSWLSPDARTLSARLVLFGQAVRYTDAVLEAVRRMGNVGFGNMRQRMRLERLVVDGVVLTPDARGLQASARLAAEHAEMAFPTRVWRLDAMVPDTSRVRLHFGGSLIKSRERQRQTDPLSFDVLMRALLRRQSLLAACHEQAWALPFGEYVAQAKGVRLASCRLRPFQWQRVSTRTGQSTRYDAFCGEVAYEGALTGFLPFLQLGLLTQVGSGTVFGMGRYEMHVRR